MFAQHLPSFGWEPIILTVNEKYYEEEPDPNLERLLPANLRIEKVSAFGVNQPRLAGDIGARAFFQLYKRAKQLVRLEKIDFLYIPIPSFYCALLGRWLHHSTDIAYGIDYIDPWVHVFPGSDRLFSRHWWSTKLARVLEPIAVKKASLITGVAAGYYKGVIERNPHLLRQAILAAMPYGGEKNDYAMIQELNLQPYLFANDPGKLQLVYAGAMLPKAHKPLEYIFKAICNNPALFSNVQIHFIGTGKTAGDPYGFNIKQLAEKYGLWQRSIFEYPKRIPYLDVLVHLDAADGVFILGSTEPHYTPSKVYQGILSAKPILAVLHKESSAVSILKQSHGGMVLDFAGEDGLPDIENKLPAIFIEYLEWIKAFDASAVDQQVFEQYSARNITRQLVELLAKVVS